MEMYCSTPSNNKKKKVTDIQGNIQIVMGEVEKDYETMTWLHFKVEKTTEHCVSKLFYTICQMYDEYKINYVTGFEKPRLPRTITNI